MKKRDECMKLCVKSTKTCALEEARKILIVFSKFLVLRLIYSGRLKKREMRMIFSQVMH